MERDQNIQLPWPDWEIIKELGHGGYGVVYQAQRSVAGITEQAAIKVISFPKSQDEIEADFTDGYDLDSLKAKYADVLQGYLNEYNLMRELNGQTNIVNCADFATVPHDDGIGWDVYIRMELLTPLNTYISDKILSEREVIGLGCDICSALERCAQRDVIHRDIKPDNIFLNEFGDFKLGDFGIARKLENMTGGLSQKGTYNYMAPEVEKGNSYGATVDIYSLGIVLYWLLNKRRLPFVSTEKKLLSPRDLVTANRRRLDGEPLPAPCNASSAMAEVILKACDPDPRKRFASAEEMKNALKTVIDGSDVAGSGREHRTENDTRQSTKGDTAQGFSPAVVNTFGEREKSPKLIIIAAILAVVFLLGSGTFIVLGKKEKESFPKKETAEISENCNGPFPLLIFFAYA